MNGYYKPPWKYSELRAKILERLEKRGRDISGTVLHIGSGRDNFKYGQYFPNAIQYRCLDVEKYPNVDIVADVQHMPQIPSSSEDCVIATFFLLLVSNIVAALKEIKRVVKPGGIVFLTFTNHNWKRRGIKRTTEQALSLLDGVFQKRVIYECDIGLAVVAYKT